MSLKPLNSVGGFSVGVGTINTIIYGNGDVSTANLTVSNYANLGNVGNVYIGGGSNGQVLQTDGSGNLTWSSSANLNEIQNGFSNVIIPTANGNIYINANAGTDKQWNFDTTGNLTSPYNLLLGNALFVGADAPGAIFNFPNSIFLGTANSSNYAQASLLNKNPNASVDWVAYVDNGNADAGYSDMGMAGSTYNVAGAGLTQPGDGYFVVSGVPGLGGNLIIATSGTGTDNDIVFGNGYDTSNEVMRFFDAGQQFQIHPTTVSTTTSTGALVVSGGVGVGGNLYAGGNVVAGNFQTTGSSGNISGANVIFATSFTSNGGNVDFATNSPNVKLGNVGNVHIGGGTSGQVLQTDGSGNLSWTSTANVSEIQNGLSNVTIPTANGAVFINSNNGFSDYQWQFANTGLLTLPDANANVTAPIGTTIDIYTGNNTSYSEIYLTDNGNVGINTKGATYSWIFANTGNTTFPAAGTANLGNALIANYANFSNNVITTNGDFVANIGSMNAFSFYSLGGTVDFNTNNANVLLGDAANVHLYGGAAGQILQTDGSGNLSWVSTASQNAIFNGNSNVSIPSSDGDVTIWSNGTEEWVFDTTGNLAAPGGITATWFAGDGGNLSNIQAGNISGTISTANTVTDNAQPNITSVGNLTNLTVGTSTPNVYIDGSGNITAGNNVTALNFTAAAPGGTVDFSTNSPNVQLGNVDNVHIYGGSTNQVLVTDGLGNLSWASGSQVSNGTSNVSIPVVNGNVYVNAGSSQWNFSNVSGLTTLPGNLYFANGVPNHSGFGIGYVSYIDTQSPLANTLVQSSILQIDELNGNVNANTANLNVGNIQTGGGSGGNISGVNYLFANVANLAGNLNANGNVNANYLNTSYDANIQGNALVNGNIIANGFIRGVFANGTSNIAIPAVNGNINLSVGGTSNVVVVTATGANVIGTIQSNGNITTNTAFVGNTITSVGTYLTIASDQVGNSTYNINLVPGGAGNVDVHNTYITSVADPVNPQDAATKQYVDNISQGLYIHPAANVLAATNLNATYTVGGVSLTVTDIIGNNTIQFSTAHGLSANADISFTNAFNGINASPDVYWVDTIPAPNQITLKATYFGPIVDSLTAGTGLSEPALAQPGVGATLTNAGTQAALTVDSVLTTVGVRVLVIGQSNQAYNGIYDVTTVGTVSTNWVLTRSADGDMYAPQSTTALGSGSFWFVSGGLSYGGSSWVLSSPPGEIDIGVTNIGLTQFSAGGTYTGANGISVVGTVISANVDNVTTAIIGGNIAVANSATFVTPNIGAATGTSLNLSGNLLAGNVNSNATIIGNSITSNTDITTTSGNANINGNILANFIVANNNFSTTSGDFTTTSGNLVSTNGNVSAQYANIAVNVNANGNVNANTAVNANAFNVIGFGNISGANVTYSNSFTANGGTVDFYNTPANVLLGNVGNVHIFGGSTNQVLVTDGSGNLSWASGSQVSNGTSNVSIPVVNGNVYVNAGSSQWNFSNTGVLTGPTTGTANLGNLIIANFANIASNLFVGGVSTNVSVTSDGNITLTGSVNASTGNVNANVVNANTANISTTITLGNTAINWATANTSSITANQTIAQVPVSGITGVEFFVKGIDASGTKYSAATVQAVTDGATTDYVIYGTTFIGGSTGSLSVNIVGSNIALQVSPSSSNSTVWTTQFRTI